MSHESGVRCQVTLQHVYSICRCSNKNNVTPASFGFFSVATSAGLADALVNVSTYVASNPPAVDRALTVFPNIIILEQDMGVQDVVQRASGGGPISLTLPLLLTGPPFPTQLGVPTPTSVSLDLTGCLGCLSLDNSTTHVYLANLHLTGLERPAASNSSSNSSISSSGDGTQLSLPLWAFHFERLPGNLSMHVHLRNVTLTLPQDEFRMLLAGLPAAGSQQGVTVAAQGAVHLKVRINFVVHRPPP